MSLMCTMINGLPFIITHNLAKYNHMFHIYFSKALNILIKFQNLRKCKYLKLLKHISYNIKDNLQPYV